MAFHKLDAKGKAIHPKKRTSRLPATRFDGGKTLYHYEIFVRVNGLDGTKDVRRRMWLEDDVAAQIAERELKTGRMAKNLKWVDAHRLWLDGNKGKFSEGHASNSVTTLRMWCERFGSDSTVEGTSLQQFSAWVEDMCKKGKGRGGQIRRAHMLAIARWCRSRGLVDAIPFEHAPKPKARLEKRPAASLNEFVTIAKLAAPEMRHLWLMLGWTGMRLSAACGLREDCIGDKSFTVITKFRKTVEYPITAMVAKVIDDARRFKADRGITSEYLFVRDTGKVWTKDRFHDRLQALLKAHGLAKVTAHRLRHMAGTLAAEAGLTPDQIKALLAQENRQSSEEYIDTSLKMRHSAMQVLESAISDVYFMSIFDTKSVPTEDSESQSKPLTAEKYNEILLHALWSIFFNSNR